MVAIAITAAYNGATKSAVYDLIYQKLKRL